MTDDLIVIDDPIKQDPSLNKINEWFDNTFHKRCTDKSSHPIFIQRRFHHEDISSPISLKNEFKHPHIPFDKQTNKDL